MRRPTAQRRTPLEGYKDVRTFVFPLCSSYSSYRRKIYGSPKVKVVRPERSQMLQGQEMSVLLPSCALNSFPCGFDRTVRLDGAAFKFLRFVPLSAD
ncbi:hypothetical protein RRG08_059445 [Elysia crispata]|uniref:Uncharacterized protein n=1 Tax=Elysia crispata TaxID=231223 RepID=A0AAE1A520_9GAST|nr:hypothetical protein RRG08_059445 [Elysia crispata]